MHFWDYFFTPHITTDKQKPSSKQIGSFFCLPLFFSFDTFRLLYNFMGSLLNYDLTVPFYNCDITSGEKKIQCLFKLCFEVVLVFQNFSNKWHIETAELVRGQRLFRDSACLSKYCFDNINFCKLYHNSTIKFYTYHVKYMYHIYHNYFEYSWSAQHIVEKWRHSLLILVNSLHMWSLC